MLRPHLPLLSFAVLLACGHVVQAGAPVFTAKRWTSPISYKLDSRFNVTEQETFRAALQVFEEKTCLDFKEGLPGLQLEYETGLPGGCWSYLGDIRTDRNQQISVQGGCIHFPGIHHETFHALGFTHTHNRPDRDTYITIDFDNIKNDSKTLYEKLPFTDQTTDYGIPYEYGSLLHYHTLSSTINNRKKSIIPKDNDYSETIDAKGQGMVFNDWKIINLHYKCHETCPEQIKCLNGGYQNARNCSQCVCTRFYDGDRCQIERNPSNLKTGETLPINFGWHFNESTYRGILTRTSEFDDSPMPDHYNLERSPARLIKAPEGNRIRVTINNLWDSELADISCFGCSDKALEIVDGDLTRVGKKFCCHKNLPYSFLSETNVVGYSVYAISGLDFVANVTFTAEAGPVTPPTEPPLTSTTTTTTTTTTTETPTTPTTTTTTTERPTSTVTRTVTEAPTTTTTTEGTTTTVTPPDSTASTARVTQKHCTYDYSTIPWRWYCVGNW